MGEGARESQAAGKELGGVRRGEGAGGSQAGGKELGGVRQGGWSWGESGRLPQERRAGWVGALGSRQNLGAGVELTP